MPIYFFRFVQGPDARDLRIEAADDDKARQIAVKKCADIVAKTVSAFGPYNEWTLEILRSDGTVRHRFRVATEDLRNSDFRSSY